MVDFPFVPEIPMIFSQSFGVILSQKISTLEVSLECTVKGNFFRETPGLTTIISKSSKFGSEQYFPKQKPGDQHSPQRKTLSH